MPWNSKIIILSYIIIAFIFTASCKNKDVPTDSVPDKLATYETEEFLKFYDQFSRDSAFQIEHTVFPLEGMKKNQDSISPPDFKWTQQEWVVHQPYDDGDGTFSREMLDLNGIVIERISDTSGKFSMERRFGKLSSGWHLIYYREMGNY
ncbi:MAG: hypothetical protein IPN89_05575 [Saprospiraceae bacterium]|nr:hypothetical protein [Saprospiraceae bacterium]